MVQLVTASNTLGRSYDYDAFGNEVNPSATDTNPFRYAGQYFDSETGTYYLRARYYDPGIGRFTQQDGWTFADPSDPLSLNLYTYCWNDPNKYVDYSGKSPIPFIIAGALALLKVLDYGWTIWDVVDSAHTLSNPNSDDASKFFAAINIAMSTSFELLEPDDLLPASIPLDDAARKVTIKTIKNKLEKNGPVAVKNYLRKTFGSAAEAGIKYLDNYIDDTIETVGKWGQGSYDSIKDSLIDHFYRHGSEVGATDVNQYLRKAEAFAQNLRGAKKFPSNGYTPNAVRYVKNGKYIIMDGGLILSFGKDIID